MRAALPWGRARPTLHASSTGGEAPSRWAGGRVPSSCASAARRPGSFRADAVHAMAPRRHARIRNLLVTAVGCRLIRMNVFSCVHFIEGWSFQANDSTNCSNFRRHGDAAGPAPAPARERTRTILAGTIASHPGGARSRQPCREKELEARETGLLSALTPSQQVRDSSRWDRDRHSPGERIRLGSARANGRKSEGQRPMSVAREAGASRSAARALSNRRPQPRLDPARSSPYYFGRSGAARAPTPVPSVGKCCEARSQATSNRQCSRRWRSSGTAPAGCPRATCSSPRWSLRRGPGRGCAAGTAAVNPMVAQVLTVVDVLPDEELHWF